VEPDCPKFIDREQANRLQKTPLLLRTQFSRLMSVGAQIVYLADL